MKGKVNCICGWSWNKSDSSAKDMYICHECGRDNSNNIPKAQEGENLLSVRDLINDTMNRKIQANKGKGKETNVTKKDNTKTVKPKVNKLTTAKQKEKKAVEQNKQAFIKSNVQANMEDAYESPLMYPGYFTPEGAAIGALQGATKLGPDLYEGDYKAAGMDALMMLPFVPHTWTINPWAEKLNSANKSYRVAGMDALKDFQNTGVLRSYNTAPGRLVEGTNFVLPPRPTSFPSFQKGFADMSYASPKGSVVFETALPTFKRGEMNPVTGFPIKGRHYAHRVINPETGATMSEIPASDIRVFGDKPNWLQGYKEIPKQKNGGWLDNYGTQANYNDSKATASPDMVGDGFSNVGRNYSPAWGGQFQKGGKLKFLQPTSDRLPEGYRIPYDTPSTERATSIGGVDGEPAYLVPEFKYGEPLYDPIEEFKRTGEHLGGPFKTWQEADEWENTVRHPAVENRETIMFPQEKFQAGGALPGSVGFTYARTKGIPSNGPYAKKTLASAQNGVDMYGNPITADLKYDQSVNRTNYNPRTNQMIFGNDMPYFVSQEQRDKTLAHENRHAWQFANDRTNFNIVHNPEYAFQDRLKKKPEHPSTEEVFENYHDRKRREVAMDVNKFKLNYPELSFMPDQLIYKKFVDSQQYDNPNSVEGEAQYYENTGERSFQNGGEMKFYQNGLDFKPKSISRDGGWLNKYDVAQNGKKQFKLKDEREDAYTVRDNIQPLSLKQKRGNELLIKETEKAKKDKQELTTTGQIKNPRSIHYKKLAPKQSDLKTQTKSNEELEGQLGLEKPLIYLASPEKLLGDLGVPGMETSELDRQAVMANRFNPNQTRLDRFVNNANIGLGYVPEAAANTAMAAAFMPEGSGALGLVNEALNPLAGIKMSIAPELRQGLRTAGPSFGSSVDNFTPTFKSEIDWGKEYFEKIQNKEKELQDLFFSKKISEKEYLEGVPLYEKELAKELGLENKLGSGNYGKVFESPNDPSKVIKLGNPMSAGGTGATNWTPELIEKLKSIKQNANIAIPEQVEYFEIPSLYKGYGPSTKEVMTMPNLNQVTAENLNLNKRDRYALFLKQARQLRDQGIQLDVANIENFKFNKDKGIFDIYDVNPGYIYNPGYYMQDVVNKTKGPLLEYMQFKKGGVIKDDMGQWKYPGQITEIGSNQITMQGVPYPVLGISDTGDTKLMKPGKDYKFKGKKVTEFPMAKNGRRQEQKGLVNLDQLTNWTNYNTKQKGGWLDNL